MKKYLLLFIITISSCSPNNNFQLNGDIKGLKKGIVILTKSIKGVEVTLDSINLNGTSKFTLVSYLNEPEVLKIKLTQSGIHNDEIEFFADKGITNFKTNLKRFSYESNFDGSQQQEKLNNFVQFPEMWRFLSVGGSPTRRLRNQWEDALALLKSSCNTPPMRRWPMLP